MELAIHRVRTGAQIETDAVDEPMMDEDAFRALHRRTADPLRAYCTRTLGSATEAEDVVQEAYLRLLRRPPQTDRPEELRAFLFRVASNLMIDYWRKRRHERGAVDERALDPGGPGADVPLQLDMARTFEKLRPRERALMWLAYVEGLSHREISGTLGVSERSVRVLLHRARVKLAALLEKR